jgi:hypothetical protein
MAQKRDTVFPGSVKWSGTRKVIQYPVKRKAELPPIQELPKPIKPKVPRLNIPVNPLSSYEVDPVPLLKGSPSKDYKKCYSLELGGSVVVVRKVPATKDLFTMSGFASSSPETQLYMLCQLKHENLLEPFQVFCCSKNDTLDTLDTFYIISKHTEISCEELIVARPDEIQLAAIIHQASFSSYALTKANMLQVLHAISYLVTQNLTHGAITCSNILLTREGVVKIGTV